MKLSNPYFLENVYQDQPYSSMLLLAPHCDFKCVGCQNKHLKNDFRDFSLNYLVERYKENPFYEGITVAGLEIFLSGRDFLEELIVLLIKTECQKFTIYTRFEKDNKTVIEFLKKIKKIATIKDLYLKTGKYIEGKNKKNVNIGNFEITLGSCNQCFEKII